MATAAVVDEKVAQKSSKLIDLSVAPHARDEELGVRMVLELRNR